MKKNIVKKITLSLFVTVLVFVLALTLPLIGIDDGEELSNIFGVFTNNKPEFQGIIEIWNIDTFDGGSSSKTSFLNKVASSYEKKKKGVYLLVKNLSEYECLNLIQKGYYPDIFSCSYGVASEIKDYCLPITDYDEIKVNEKLLNSGKIGNDIYGIAWCYGYYSLISSKNHLKNANFFNRFNISEDSDFKLSDYASLCGYQKQKKSKYGREIVTKTISSLTYGYNKYLLPNYALSSYNSKGLNTNLDFAVNEKVATNTSYDAYTQFLSGESVMLLGSQRDEVRINGRVENGKMQDVIMEKITSFTDLIQYIFLAKGDNLSRQKVSLDFIKELLLDENQRKLLDIKLCPTIDIMVNNDNTMSHITSDFFKDCAVNNVFISKSEIIKLQ